LRREEALVLAKQVLAALFPVCSWAEIAGSIRRERAEVHDIDLVAIPSQQTRSGPLGGTVIFDELQVWKDLIPKALKKIGLTVEAQGQELIRCTFADNGFQVDIYRARPETWGVILLVRTGSREHNVKLYTLAKSKGLTLSAARGVISYWVDGRRLPEAEGKVIASRSEEEIFAALGLAYVDPKHREVSY
jgi:DNA polymerase (family 10)